MAILLPRGFGDKDTRSPVFLRSVKCEEKGGRAARCKGSVVGIINSIVFTLVRASGHVAPRLTRLSIRCESVTFEERKLPSTKIASHK